MITSRDLMRVPVFAGVDEQERKRLARLAAYILLEPNEWLFHEGEEPNFYIFLEGELEAVKEILGHHQVVGRSHAGEFSGETPIFVGTAELVSLRAITRCRIARFERQQLQELVRDSPSAGEIIFQTMSSRVALAQRLACATPSSRVRIVGSKYDETCRAIRTFCPPTGFNMIGCRMRSRHRLPSLYQLKEHRSKTRASVVSLKLWDSRPFLSTKTTTLS